jgi:drug/metabolite transporter (DMT)-like permease
MIPTRIALKVVLAMVAFAANSILCRIALKETVIDAASFTSIRMIAGAAALYLIVKLRKTSGTTSASRTSAIALMAYATAFSFAYRSLPAGQGALLLFASVQATMIAYAFFLGERLALLQTFGLIVALVGLFVLLRPGLESPPVGASALMIIAGLAWGTYSLRGRKGGDPAKTSAGNFLRTVPLSLALVAVTVSTVHLNATGVLCAIASGALASGVGYVIWYSALPALQATVAASVQLSVPVLSAFGGLLLLGEPVSLRLIESSTAVLGGIALVILAKRRPTVHKPDTTH